MTISTGAGGSLRLSCTVMSLGTIFSGASRAMVHSIKTVLLVMLKELTRESLRVKAGGQGTSDPMVE